MNLLKECINCSSPKVDASDRVESLSTNSWSRHLVCRKCGLKWKQLFFRGNFEVQNERGEIT